MSDPLCFDLPMPPSVWKLYRGNGASRSRTKEYNDWIKEAGWMLIQQRNKSRRHKLMLGDIAVTVTAYRAGNKSRDLDNILKAILDLLVNTQTIKDDSQVVDIWARWVDEGVPCTVKVEPIPVAA